MDTCLNPVSTTFTNYVNLLPCLSESQVAHLQSRDYCLFFKRILLSEEQMKVCLQSFTLCLEMEYVLKSCKPFNHSFSLRLWKISRSPYSLRLSTSQRSQDQLKDHFVRDTSSAPPSCHHPTLLTLPQPFTSDISSAEGALLCQLTHVSLLSQNGSSEKRLSALHFLVSLLCLTQRVLCAFIE